MNTIKYQWIANIVFAKFILFLSYCSIAQTKIKVVSQQNYSSLPYASIANITIKRTFIANENGIAFLNIDKGDSIQISYVGYKIFAYRSKGTTSEIIQLIPETQLLKEVVIQKCKLTNEISIRNFSKPKKHYLPNGSLNTKTEINMPYAVLITTEKEISYLKKFSFWISRFKSNAAPDSAIHNPILLSVYEVSESNNMPSTPLINKPIIYFPEKEGRQTIDFDSLHLLVPSKGVFIYLQYLQDEKYVWDLTVKDALNDYRDTAYKVYGGLLEIENSLFLKAYRYDPIKNNWLSAKAIKCEAVLNYCKKNN